MTGSLDRRRDSSRLARRCATVLALAALSLAAAPRLAGAATYYVATTGDNSTSCAQAQNPSTPRQTIQSALSCLTSGSTLIIRNGTYGGSANTIANIPNGTAAAYTTIKAEVDGSVILTAPLATPGSTSYVRFEGLRFHSSLGRNILGNHLKFLRCEFKGGCATGNCTNTTVGSNDVNNTADILIEDSWFHGSGGRYDVLIYNADRVVIRRVVIRHDGGWSDGGSADPEAGLIFYNSANIAALNVIVIDSNLSYSTWAGSFYQVKNDSVPHLSQNNSLIGSIALVGADLGMRNDGNSAGTLIQDVVFWDTVNGGISFGGSSSHVSATVNRVTIGRSKLPPAGDFQGGIGSWGPGSKVVTNSIFTGWSAGSDLVGVSAIHFDTYANESSSSGTGRLTVNPLTSGLTYLPRIESGSTLRTAGYLSNQLGANIVNRIGAAESLYGEQGWNAETSVALWPWPNSARITNEMCTQVGVTRGFCSDTSITNYIWNYLGHGNPFAGGIPPSAPSNVRLIP